MVVNVENLPNGLYWTKPANDGSMKLMGALHQQLVHMLLIIQL